MGYGTFMNVTNQRQTAISTYVTDQRCMYDGGAEGSNLSLFNAATIQGASTLPGGSGQYIEVKNSGSCWFGSGMFTLKVEDAATLVTIGELVFSDKTASWTCTNTNPDAIDVYINNSGPQGAITVTVENSSGAERSARKDPV